jgi:hypothetical protein
VDMTNRTRATPLAERTTGGRVQPPQYQPTGRLAAQSNDHLRDMKHANNNDVKDDGDDDDDDDDDIATVYSKEYSHMAAMFTTKQSGERGGGHACSPTTAACPTEAQNHQFKIVGVEPTSTLGVADHAITNNTTTTLQQPTLPSTSLGVVDKNAASTPVDLEWNVSVNPQLLQPPSAKAAPPRPTRVPRASNKARINKDSLSLQPLVKQHRCQNRRWIVVFLCAGIFVAALVVAIGVAIVRSQQTQRVTSAATSASMSKNQTKVTTPPMNLDSTTPPTKDSEASSTNEPLQETPFETPRPTTAPTSDPTATAAKRPKSGPGNNVPPSPPSPMPSSNVAITTPTPTTTESLYATQTLVAALISGPSSSIGNDPQGGGGGGGASFWTTLPSQLSLLDAATVNVALYLGGSLRVSNNNNKGKCKAEDYTTAATALQSSTVPVLVVASDADWADCPNPDEAYGFWYDAFIGQLDALWTHSMVVKRAVASDNGLRATSFTVEYRDILVVGLTLPGSTSAPTTNGMDWDSQLQSEFNWTKAVIQDYQERLQPAYTGRVVLVGQATPTADHAIFFDQLSNFIAFDLQNRLPMVYVNGNGQSWSYESGFYNQPSFVHITVADASIDTGIGETSVLPLPTLEIVANGDLVNAEDAFLYSSEEESAVSEQGLNADATMEPTST